MASCSQNLSDIVRAKIGSAVWTNRLTDDALPMNTTKEPDQYRARESLGDLFRQPGGLYYR